MSEQLERGCPRSMVTWIQKIALYETKARYFIIGSDATQNRIRVLKIDRTEHHDLVVIDDKVEYTQKEIHELLERVNDGNKQSKGSSSGFIRTMSAYGIFGFVRFLAGYYIILITKRRKVAQIGHHSIYKVEDTSMVYIPNTTEKPSNDEVRYLKIFKHIDLSSNFYFSYSYDITHTLQYNMCPFSETSYKLTNDKTIWETQLKREILPTKTQCRNKPLMKFVWNEYLLSGADISAEWLLHIIHGFVSHANISVFGKPLHLTLIARRSQKFAGTRFLKRGANYEGDVGNEVETEQILMDASLSSFEKGKYTSFVQMRGSIPAHWSQDISKMVPKPAISLDIVEPFCYTAGVHFNQLLSRYGSPIIILNLVKKREQRPHESVLRNEIIKTVSYLNQFLPPEHAIEHIGFDMARQNKRKDVNVMRKLSNYAYYVLKKVGIFQSWSNNVHQKLRNADLKVQLGGIQLPTGRLIQTGIVRVNCVDCLDRTNTAQFALGRCALAFQLFALGVLDKPELEFETDTVRLLEELYEDHGDTLALQYGGSQLVHRIKTYRKIAPLSSHSRDIMHTLSRYYSNTFSDWDKQNAMNLFLGIFRAYDHPNIRIWDLSTDFYLHNSISSGKPLNRTKPYTMWWDESVAVSLPRAAIEIFKGESSKQKSFSEKEEAVEELYEQYSPYELTSFMDSLHFHIPHTEKDMPNFTAEYSPFCVRMRPGKRLESVMSKNAHGIPRNPSVSGHVSSASTSSSASEFESDSSEDETDKYVIVDPDEGCSSKFANSFRRTFASVLPNSRETYGQLFKNVSLKDVNLYGNYVNMKMNVKKDAIYRYAVSGTTASLSEKDLKMYKEYVDRKDGQFTISKKTSDLYTDYITKLGVSSD